MLKSLRKNFVFIDAQNLTMGLREIGWNIDWRKFSVYLNEKYKANRTFVFIGYIEKNKYFYDFLRSCGYILIFKPVIELNNGTKKGNCDGDMIMYIVSKMHNYNKAVIVTSDGDFYSTVALLARRKKLEVVLSPNMYKCSGLLKKEAKDRIFYMNQLRGTLSFTLKRKSTAIGQNL